MSRPSTRASASSAVARQGRLTAHCGVQAGNVRPAKAGAPTAPLSQSPAAAARLPNSPKPPQSKRAPSTRHQARRLRPYRPHCRQARRLRLHHPHCRRSLRFWPPRQYHRAHGCHPTRRRPLPTRRLGGCLRPARHPSPRRRCRTRAGTAASLAIWAPATCTLTVCTRTVQRPLRLRPRCRPSGHLQPRRRPLPALARPRTTPASTTRRHRPRPLPRLSRRRRRWTLSTPPSPAWSALS